MATMNQLKAEIAQLRKQVEYLRGELLTLALRTSVIVYAPAPVPAPQPAYTPNITFGEPYRPGGATICKSGWDSWPACFGSR